MLTLETSTVSSPELVNVKSCCPVGPEWMSRDPKSWEVGLTERTGLLPSPSRESVRSGTPELMVMVADLLPVVVGSKV